MKRIFVFMLCALLLCVTPVVACAAEEAPETEASMTDTIVDYVKDHIEEILVVVFMALGSMYEARIRGKLNGTVGTLNNNAISIAQNSAGAIEKALEKVEVVEAKLNAFSEKIDALIGEIGKSAEEKKALEGTLTHVEGFLKTAKLATIELANEVADLLVLANIPVSKKEELYSRHRAAVDAIAVAESEVKGNDGEEA